MNEKRTRLQEFFQGDRFAMNAGCRIDEVLPGYAKCSLLLSNEHRNAMGNVMGGVSFTLADFTVAVAANQDETGQVALDASFSFLGRARGAQLIAEARCLKDGRTTSYYQVNVYDEHNNPVAAGGITVFHTLARK